jgi:hypothetical protein
MSLKYLSEFEVSFLCTAIRQFHSFSRGFLTADYTDCTDENTALAFSYPCHPCHPWSIHILVAAPPRCGLCVSAHQEQFNGIKRERDRKDDGLARIAGWFSERPIITPETKGMYSRRVAEDAEKSLIKGTLRSWFREFQISLDRAL